MNLYKITEILKFSTKKWKHFPKPSICHNLFYSINRTHFNEIAPDHPETPEEDYKWKCFEAIHLVTSCIKDCFDQKDFEMYVMRESLPVKSENKEDHSAELEIITNFYSDDFTRKDLDIQPNTLPFIRQLNLRRCKKSTTYFNFFD